jgi:hypothetical protein
MALGLVSPGIKVREVDLTVGRVDSVSQLTGAIVGPFERGPVEQAVLIENEKDLINVFGKPAENDNQYEYWYSASNYLTYGGVLRTVRADGSNLNNANAPTMAGIGSTTVKIKNYEDYTTNYTEASGWYYAAKDPGVWANNLKVCVIDAFADQRLIGVNTGISTSTTATTVGVATTAGTFSEAYDVSVGVDTTGLAINDGVSGTYIGAGTTILSIGVGTVYLSLPSSAPGAASTTLTFNRTTQTVQYYGAITVGAAVTQLGTFAVAGVGTTTSYTGFVKGVVTGIGMTHVDVKITSVVNSTTQVETAVNYTPGLYAFNADTVNGFIGIGTTGTTTATAVDWYNQQTLGLINSTVYWNAIAPKPGTSTYANARSAKNDEIHVVVVDDTGSVTGIAGNILEKHIGLSKATDGQLATGQPIYYKNYIADGSAYIYAGAAPGGSATGFGGTTGGSWGQKAQGVTFNAAGAKTYTLLGGNTYGSSGISSAYTDPRYSVTLGDVMNGYKIFEAVKEYPVNYLIMGPGFGDKLTTQAKANQLINIAETRKDCVALISPHRSAVVDVANAQTQTDNIINFYEAVTSSSYAVFDSGYKYQYDRFNNKFRYLPLNADIAGCLCRTVITDFPWFSPAGARRGVINNAVKLAFNPTQAQRDLLYVKRINPVVYSPGAGIVLFGDKTGLSYASAFDRINVRMLFLTIEAAIERAARDQLFEFNDTITRSNFVNIVEPYLRDVVAKRGILDYRLICDETNNTPDVIDANEFRADIYVKPARSINFIGLTFVATRTGISFEEVVGRV